MSAGEGTEAERELSELMVAYQRGELTAFEELYQRLSGRLRSYLSSLTWSSARAEDLLQETFLQMHRSRQTYLPGRAVIPWAFAIARHVFLMERRAAARRARMEVDAGDELPEVPVPAAVEGFATRQTILRALGALTLDGREAVLLHHVFGLTFGEIGGLLGIREGTAKLRAHRAIQSLRENLQTNPDAETDK